MQKNKSMQIHSLIFVFVILLLGCSSNPFERQAWDIVNQTKNNSKELGEFLRYYKELGNKNKYTAACFLISNISNKYSIYSNDSIVYDIDVVKSDSLIKSLDFSFELLTKSPFLKSYSMEQFFEYILPYRIANEPLEYKWKWELQNMLSFTSKDIIAAAEEINAQIDLKMSPENYAISPKSYSALVETGYGKCDDRTTLVTMALRSIGIPAAYEFVPFWGSSNNGHSFVSIIRPDGTIHSLQNTNKVTMDGYLSRKSPKIYRRMYRNQTSYSSCNNIPPIFSSGDLQDVTSLHQIGSTDIDITGYINMQYKTNYLSVFSPNGWIPVAMSNNNIFQSVGTGIRLNEKTNPEAENLGNGILYLPSSWNGNCIPNGNPIIVSINGIRKIICDTLNSTRVIIKRKYPLNYRIINFAKLMIGGVFEGANKADFSDADKLLCITSIPVSKMQYVTINTDKSYRYIRYRREKGTFSLAEITVKNERGESVSYKPLLCEALKVEKDVMLIYDGNPLSYYQTGGNLELWAGMDFGQPIKIHTIGFAPRNDDNAINDKDLYELFYWNNTWKSLGKKRTKTDTLIYNNVPSGALLWLQNLTKGKEERPFTYEDSKQIWW